MSYRAIFVFRFFQIVLDVCDFVGAVRVKIVEGKEIVVEGKGNRQEGGSVVSFSFCRRYMLHDDTDLDAITAIMSSEGILTITVPRKVQYSKHYLFSEKCLYLQ